MPSVQELDRNMPILVVDDYPSMRRIVKNCLRQLGFENVTEAENMQEALSQIEITEFKFVIADWTMPEMPGSAVVETLRTHEKTRTVPMLVVTAPQQREEVVAIEEVSGASVIVKPFTREILQKKMEQVFGATLG